jgi:hypothetical protein
MDLSNQAIAALTGYVLVAIAIFIPIKSDPKNPESYNVGNRLLVLLTMLIPAVLSVYTINCLVQGSCEIWSWINAVLVFLWSLLILGVALYGAFASPSPAVALATAPAKPATAPKA